MKNIKKALLIIVLLTVSASCIFAWQNTYRASDDAYKNLMLLKELSGVEFPVATAPVSSMQMSRMLDLIKYEELNGYAKELYDSLKKELGNPTVLFAGDTVGADLNLWLLPVEVIDDFSNESSKEGFFRSTLNRYDLFDVDMKLFITPYFYGRLNANGTVKATDEGVVNSVVNLGKMSQAWPQQAYASVGVNAFNFIIGRDRLSAGNGKTGNMYLSENRQYDDFAKFSISKYPVSYDFTIAVYDGYTADSDFDNNNCKLRTTDFEGPDKTVLVHRFSSTLFNKLTISAYEGAVIYGNGIRSDVRALNPFMFIHNNGTYYTGNTNNFAGLEIGAAVSKSVSANAQIIVDQFKLSDEKEDSGDTQFGVLANIKAAHAFNKGILSAYAEGIYATEGLYLKEINNAEYGYNYNDRIYHFAQTDMISGNKRFSGERDEICYLGYPSGGDIKKLALGLDYKMKDCEFALDCAFSAKGCHGINSDMNEVRVLTENAKAGYEKDQYCLSFAASAKALFMKGIECTATIADFNYRNYCHENGVDKNFVQFSLGCKVDPTLIFIKRNSL